MQNEFIIYVPICNHVLVIINLYHVDSSSGNMIESALGFWLCKHSLGPLLEKGPGMKE